MVALAVLGLALLAPSMALAWPRLGLWVGTAPNDARVSFIVRWFEGRRVIGSPAIACPALQIPGYGLSKYEFDSLDDSAYSTPNGTLGPAIVTPVARNGDIAYNDYNVVPTAPLYSRRSLNAMYGTLGQLRGRLVVNSLSACIPRPIEVHWVSSGVRGDGIYEGTGSYLTRVAFQLVGGGTLMQFLVNGGSLYTQFGGPPDPKTTEALGPEAGLEACVSALAPGVVPLPAGTSFRDVITQTFPPEIGTLAVTGKFVSPTVMVGAYIGFFTFADETECPLPGVWEATRVQQPSGIRWPTGFKPKTLRYPKCRRVSRIVDIPLDPETMGEVIAHIKAAIDGPEHWPRVLVINRPFAPERRDKLMRDRRLAVKKGEDRDEYPPAALRGRGGPGLRRGVNPVGWKADLFPVPRGQNRLAGNVQSRVLGPYCDGQEVEFTY